MVHHTVLESASGTNVNDNSVNHEPLLIARKFFAVGKRLHDSAVGDKDSRMRWRDQL